ncbi:hypothetical protein L9F63_025227, partial [Diploptera punctata]
TVGLNQCVQYSHRLLQSLIIQHKCHQSSAIIQMYLNGTIQLSEHSLRTLQVILKTCDLPENVDALNSISSGFSILPKQSLRCALLDWILPNREDVSFSELKLVPFLPQFMSKVLVEIAIRSQNDVDSDTFNGKSLSINSIEDDYWVSSFEMGLLIADSDIRNVRKMSVNNDSKLVITSVRDKLIELLIRDCNILEEREYTPTESKMKLKIVQDYISECMLVSSVLSWMLRWNVITSYALPTF